MTDNTRLTNAGLCILTFLCFPFLPQKAQVSGKTCLPKLNRQPWSFYQSSDSVEASQAPSLCPLGFVLTKPKHNRNSHSNKLHLKSTGQFITRKFFFRLYFMFFPGLGAPAKVYLQTTCGNWVSSSTPGGSQGSNSGHQACLQAPLPLTGPTDARLASNALTARDRTSDL